MVSYDALTRLQLARGMVGDKFETSNLRISDVGWLHDQVTGVDKLINRVELITGLDVSTRVYRNNETYMSADEFQVSVLRHETLEVLCPAYARFIGLIIKLCGINVRRTDALFRHTR